MLKKVPILSEVFKFSLLPGQSEKHLEIKYCFQERNQHTLWELVASFAFVYRLLEFLPLPMLNNTLVW